MQNNKKNKRLPMPEQVKRGFHCYRTMVLIVATMVVGIIGAYFGVLA